MGFLLRLIWPLLLSLASSPVMAEAVSCHYYYGGEENRLDVQSTPSPYVAPNIAVGSYFQFRVVFQTEPADLASVKVYVYADRDTGLVPIHVAAYPYPPTGEATARFGFTGQQFVYEPLRDGEFQYWCRKS